MAAVAALAAWVLNSVVGLCMLGRWLARHRAMPSPSGFPPRVAFIHFATASCGLALWITYLSTDRPAALAWTAFALLNVNNGLGDILLTRGWRDRHASEEHVDRRSRARDYLRATGETLSGKRPVALMHGLLGGAVYFLVLLAALGVAN
jgi:hypothetical protein